MFFLNEWLHQIFSQTDYDDQKLSLDCGFCLWQTERNQIYTVFKKTQSNSIDLFYTEKNGLIEGIDDIEKNLKINISSVRRLLNNC